MRTIETPDPLTVPGDRSVSVIRAWVALYTRGLPEPLAVARRAVIDGDLWDEADAARWLDETSGLPRQRWSRWVRGLPADISWRIAHSRIPNRPRRSDMRISKVQLAAIGGVVILYAVMIVGLISTPDFLEWSGMPVALLGLGISLVGLLLAVPRPKSGFIVGALGTGLAFMAMPWMFPLYLPLPIVLGYRLNRSQGVTQVSATGT